MTQELRICTNEAAFARTAADFIYDEITRSAEQTGRAHVVLSGGKTPELCYTLLCERFSDGNNPDVAWILGDERWVRPDHPDSNERMVRASLFAHGGRTPGTLHSWNACATSQFKTAAGYGELAESLLEGRDGPDLLLLGLGNDGHTASLFPGSCYLEADGELVPIRPDVHKNALALYLQRQKTWRLTLTPRLLNRAKTVIFLVSGAAKKAALSLLRARNPLVPASWIEGGRTIIFATEDALDRGMNPETPPTGQS